MCAATRGQVQRSVGNPAACAPLRIRIQIQALRVHQTLGADEHRIRREEPPHRGTVVSGPEVVVAGFLVAFFAGRTGSLLKYFTSAQASACAIAIPSRHTLIKYLHRIYIRADWFEVELCSPYPAHIKRLNNGMHDQIPCRGWLVGYRDLCHLFAGEPAGLHLFCDIYSNKAPAAKPIKGRS